MYIGITKAFLTHSQWLKYSYNQNLTPYTDNGRKLHQRNSHCKKQPLSRPPLYDIKTLKHSKEDAYNRDKGKCKICGIILNSNNRHCHRADGKLSLYEINRVPNLVWICKECDNYVHGNKLPNAEKKIITKIQKYKLKL